MSEDPAGYGRPPRQHQFRKGQSGNPSGRPKGSKGISPAIERILKRKVQLKLDGRRSRVPVTEAVMLQLSQKALAGDTLAIREFMRIAESWGAVEERQAIIDRAHLDPFVDAHAIVRALVDLGLAEATESGRLKLSPDVVGDRTAAGSDAVAALRLHYLVGTPDADD